MERKVIGYQELCALDDVLMESTDDDTRICYTIDDDRVVNWKVHWSCRGSVGSAEALMFAKALTWCAEKADALNRIGYTVDFSKWMESRTEYEEAKKIFRDMVDKL